MKKILVLLMTLAFPFMVACGGGGAADSETLPTAPSGLVCTATAADTVQLTWQDNSGDETGFHIYMLPDRASPVKSVGAGVTSTIVTGLLAGSLYQFEVTAYNAVGESSFSNTASDSTPLPPVPVPATPSGLAVVPVSSSEAGLTWTDNSDDEDEFRIYRGTTSINVNSLVGSVSADSTIYIDTTISSGQPYYYKVAAHNVGGESIASNVVSVTTYSPGARWEIELHGFTVCPPNTNQVPFGYLGWGLLSEDTPGELTLHTDQGDLTGYYAPQDGGYLVVFTNGTLEGTAVNPLLLRATSDWSEIHSASGSIGGAGAACQGPVTSGFFDRIGPLAPEAPSGLTATALTSSIIELTWTDHAASETQYRVYRGTYLFGIDTLVATLPPGAVHYRDEGLSANTSYVYQVVAANTFGDSPRSNPDSAKTLPASTIPPGAPSVLSVTLSSDTTASVTWQDNSGDEEGFRVYRGTSSGSINTLVGTAGINQTSYEDSGLGGGVTYYYQAAAFNGAGESGRSNYDSVSTPSNTPVPDPPSGLTATALSGTEIQLDWIDGSDDETGFTIYRRIGSCSGTGTFLGLYTAPANATSKVVTGLASNTTYCFKVAAVNGAGRSGFSNTASDTTEFVPATLRIVNNTHYDMIDVRIDGDQQFSYPDRILPEGGWQEWAGAAGTYFIQVGVGFYDTDESLLLLFSFEGNVTVTEGETFYLNIENPTIGEWLAGNWRGTVLCGGQYNTVGYKINSDNTWNWQINGISQNSGSITNVIWETYDTAIDFNINGPTTLFFPFGVIYKEENLPASWNCPSYPWMVEYTPY